MVERGVATSMHLTSPLSPWPAREASGRRKLPPAVVGRTALLLALTACGGPNVLDPHGPIGAADRLIVLNSLVIMLAIVIPTIIAVGIFAWWYRASNPRARYQPRFVYSGRLELVVWSIPILAVLFLSGVIWIGSHDLDPRQPIASNQKPLDVQVISLDWKWLFVYPEQGVASIDELVVPAGVPLHFSLTSATVMNTFFVPQLGSMIYTMYGMVTQLHLLASGPGDFYGLSGQLSGDGFSDMHFTLRAVATDAFTAWVNTARQSGPVLDRAAYTALLKQSVLRPYTYRAIDPKLFNAVATRQLPPGEGPETGRPAPNVHPVR